MKHIEKIIVIALSLASISSYGALKESLESIDHDCFIGATNYVNKFASNWEGWAHVTKLSEEGKTVTSVAGFPIPEAKHEKALTLLGYAYVENELSDENKEFAQVDYLQEVTEYVNHFNAQDLEDVQIALATAAKKEDDPTMVGLYLRCRPKGSNDAAWVSLDNYVKLGSWMRVNLLFDYTNQTCRVSVNGVPMMSQHGYWMSDCKKENSTGLGSWYKLATKEHKHNIKNIEFMGIFTHFDDIVIDDKHHQEYNPFPKDESAIVDLVEDAVDWKKATMDDINRWGIDPKKVDIETASLDDSGLTIAQKLEVGYDPMDGKKFGPTNMHYSIRREMDKDKEYVTLTFPQAVEADDLIYKIRARGTYEEDIGTHKKGEKFDELLPAERTSLDNATSATSKIPEGAPRVLKFNLQAERTPKK